MGTPHILFPSKSFTEPSESILSIASFFEPKVILKSFPLTPSPLTLIPALTASKFSFPHEKAARRIAGASNALEKRTLLPPSDKTRVSTPDMLFIYLVSVQFSAYDENSSEMIITGFSEAYAALKGSAAQSASIKDRILLFMAFTPVIY